MATTTRARKQPTAEQKAAAAAKRERFTKLAQTVSKMSEDERLAMVSRAGGIVTCEGRALSPFNSCLLLSQMADVRMVGGFWQWQNAGRRVRKGATGIGLWIPAKAKAGTEAHEQPTPETTAEAGAKSRARFIMGTVFDISQTQPLDERTAEVLDEIGEE